MTLQASTTSNLNPFAPEYNRIPRGVAPSPNAPPPSFFPPRPPAAAHPPPSSPYLQPPHLLPHQIHTYLPSTSHNTQQFYLTSTYSTYYVTPENHVPATPPPQRPPPPTAAFASRCGQLWRGSTRRGRGSGRGRESFRSESGEKIRNFNCARNCVGFSKHEQYSKRGMQRQLNRHKIMPLNRDEEHTTVMIKNIPYDCPRKKLMNMLDDFCLLENEKASNEGISRGKQPIKSYAYDFLYLPIDFRTKKSRGFAFVNFTTSRAVWKFYHSFHLTKWAFVDRLKWPKNIEIVSAKIQGKEAQLKHFLESYFECETDEYLPVCFSPARDGSGQPVELTVVGNRRPAARWESRHNHKP